MMSNMGGELDSEPMDDQRREALAVLPHGTRESPQLGSFQALLDYEWPEAMATAATSERLWAFVTKGARVADAMQQEFNQMVTDFWVELEDVHEDM